MKVIFFLAILILLEGSYSKPLPPTPSSVLEFVRSRPVTGIPGFHPPADRQIEHQASDQNDITSEIFQLVSCVLPKVTNSGGVFKDALDMTKLISVIVECTSAANSPFPKVNDSVMRELIQELEVAQEETADQEMFEEQFLNALIQNFW